MVAMVNIVDYFNAILCVIDVAR
uniref:Uncharacterized protein n=1 Tax=Tetranychus urticae TaxID=32264 RepID=T1JR07_TETUR